MAERESQILNGAENNTPSPAETKSQPEMSPFDYLFNLNRENDRGLTFFDNKKYRISILRTMTRVGEEKLIPGGISVSVTDKDIDRKYNYSIWRSNRVDGARQYWMDGYLQDLNFNNTFPWLSEEQKREAEEMQARFVADFVKEQYEISQKESSTKKPKTKK